jgi:selenocysteine-specific elongation factor
MRRLVLGTAGHIDHGKTALVRALTGVDTDRLPEEKRRGITIDLGFARLPLDVDLELAIVDVPGHEAFVRNMLAGATGIDLALLVIAADEGVMPQTREHAAILELLGVPRIAVALTKADLVDADWLELARDDVRGLLADTPFTGAPIVNVSATTRTGLDELTRTLASLAGDAAARSSDDLFRMPIDRVFTVRGTGTVVTGTVWSGSLERDATVRIEPAGLVARVRGLQRHMEPCDRLVAGERGAAALVGVERGAIARGDALLVGSGWMSTSILTVRLAALRDADPPLLNRQRVRVSLGTAEVLARLALPTGALEPGDEALAQLRLEQPLVARAGDRFVIRSYSPVRTIGGGTVLEPQAPKRKHFDDRNAAALATLAGAGQGSTLAALRALLDLAGERGVPVASLAVTTGATPALVAEALASPDSAAVRAGDVLLPLPLVEACHAALLDTVDAHHRERPLDDGIDRDALRRAAGSAAVVFDAATARALASGSLQSRGNAIGRPAHVPAPAAGQAGTLEALLAAYRAAGLEAPTLEELPAPLQRDDTPALVRFLERRGDLVRLGANRWAFAPAVAECVTALRGQYVVGLELGIADFKQVVNLTRKHLIPLLEYLDSVGVTLRTGESRRLAPSDPATSAAVAAPPG